MAVVLEAGEGLRGALPLRRDVISSSAEGSPAGAPSPRRRSSTLHAPRTEERSQPLALVVDPDSSARSMLTMGLSRRGFSVVSHRDAEAALGALRQGLPLPTVVICEAELHAMDGFSFCSQLRSDARTAEVAVVLLSRRAEGLHRELALSSGADQFLPKPLYLNDVVALAQLFASKRTPSGAFECRTEEAPLMPLLRALLSGSRSGRIELGGRGYINFREGRVVDAGCEAVRGVPALTRLILCAEGTYAVSFGPSLVPASFSLGLQELCTRTFPLVERWNDAVARSVPLDAVLEVEFRALSRSLDRLPDAVNGLVRLFDGHRTVRECVLDGPLDEVTALEVATRLYAMGIVVPVPEQSVLIAGQARLESAGSRPGSSDTQKTSRRPGIRTLPTPLLALPMLPPLEKQPDTVLTDDSPFLEPRRPTLEVTKDELLPSVSTSPSEWVSQSEIRDGWSSDADDGRPPAFVPKLDQAGLTEEAVDWVSGARAAEAPSQADDLLPPSMGAAVAQLELDASLVRHLEAFGIEPVVEDATATPARVRALPPSPASALVPPPATPVTPVPTTAAGEAVITPLPPEVDATFFELPRLDTTPLRRAAEPRGGGFKARALTVLSLVAGVLLMVGAVAAVFALSPEHSSRRETTPPATKAAVAQRPAVPGALTPSPAPGAAVPPLPPSPVATQKSRAVTVPASAPVSSITPAAPVPASASTPAVASSAGSAVVSSSSTAPASALAASPAVQHASAIAPPRAQPPAPKSGQGGSGRETTAPAPVASAPPPVTKPADDATLARGLKLYEAGRTTQAAKVLERVVARDKRSAEAWLLLGMARFDAGNRRGAEQAAQQALALQPKNGRALMLLASVYLEAGDRERARATLERYLVAEPAGKFAGEARQLLEANR